MLFESKTKKMQSTEIRNAAIGAFLSTCYQDEMHTSFACFVEPHTDGSGKFATHTLQVSRKNPGAEGRVRAHVFSITKSMLGLLWALYIYNADGKHPYLYSWLRRPEYMTLRTYLDQRSPLMAIHLLPERPLWRMLTMSSGLPVGDTNGLYLLLLRAIESRVSVGVEGFNNFPALVYDSYNNVSEITLKKDEGSWRYSDTCMQIASIACEEFERAISGNKSLTARDEIARTFFPPSLRSRYEGEHSEWPMVLSGYEDSGKQVLSTLTFYGLQMTGLEMRDLAVNLLTHHHALLLKIHGEIAAADGSGLAVNIDDEDDPHRLGWRYWLFWWIPTFTDSQSDASEKWISAIGHMGQFLLMELVTKTAYIRQHYDANSLIEKIDLKHVMPGKSDIVRMPHFPAVARTLWKTLFPPPLAAPGTGSRARRQRVKTIVKETPK